MRLYHSLKSVIGLLLLLARLWESNFVTATPLAPNNAGLSKMDEFHGSFLFSVRMSLFPGPRNELLPRAVLDHSVLLRLDSVLDAGRHHVGSSLLRHVLGRAGALHGSRLE